MNTKQKKRPAKRRLIGEADTKRENGRRGGGPKAVEKESRHMKSECSRRAFIIARSKQKREKRTKKETIVHNDIFFSLRFASTMFTG